MLDRPWIRALVGVVVAVALGAVAARVVGAGSPSSAGVAGRSSGGSSSSGGGGGGSSRGADAGGAGADSSDAAGTGSGGVAVSTGGGRITVHVAGAVRRPGVYRLAEGDRVYQAVRRAGGASRGADRSGLNLAAPLRDGQQVLVPSRVRGGGGGGTAAGADAPVDLNTADADDLDELDGIGPTTAAKIVALRQERGGLGGVDDLDEIPGIGPKTLETLRAQLGR